MARLRSLIVAAVLCLLPAGTALRAQITADPCDIVTERYDALIAEARKGEANVARHVHAGQMLPANKQRALIANIAYYDRTIARLRTTYPLDIARCRKRLQQPRTRTEQALERGPASSDRSPGTRREQEVGPGFSDLPPLTPSEQEIGPAR